MDRKELDKFLESYDRLVWSEHPEKPGSIIIKFEDDEDECAIIIDTANMSNVTSNDIIRQLHNGRNIQQMTRVTGFFSRVSSWNSGKIAELKDRHRSGLE